MSDTQHCSICDNEMDGSETFDDICDECAVLEGFIEDDEYE